MPSENVRPSGTAAEPGGAERPPTSDRRARKREQRRDHLLDLAADLVEAVGPDGVTMAALAEAADYAPASLYTYFSSRSALLAALQQRALLALRAVAVDHQRRVDERLLAANPAGSPDPTTAALARLWAFADLFLAAPDQHPREFRLQQQLLVSPGIEEAADAATVVPAALAVLDVPRSLLAAAAGCGALAAPTPSLDPLGQPADGHQVRTLAWIVALNGALLTDGLATGLPSTGVRLGVEITDALLRGWGADPATLAAARTTTEGWTR